MLNELLKENEMKLEITTKTRKCGALVHNVDAASVKAVPHLDTNGPTEGFEEGYFEVSIPSVAGAAVYYQNVVFYTKDPKEAEQSAIERMLSEGWTFKG